MNVAGDSAEQVVRFSLEAFEVVARLTGSGAKEALAMMFAILKDREDKSVGKTRLENMLKTCKNMDIFSIQKKDLNKYHQCFETKTLKPRELLVIQTEYAFCFE